MKKYCSKHFFLYLYMLGFQVLVEKFSDKKTVHYFFYTYFSIEEIILAGKNILSTFFEKYLVNAPSRKSALFELALPMRSQN